jgi:hypothetical protein
MSRTTATTTTSQKAKYRDVATEDEALNSTNLTASLLSLSRVFADTHWQKSKALLYSNPSLMTYHMLCLALKHHASVDVIASMIQINPTVASVPKQGLSPLQVAVQSSCNVEIIRVVIQACPLALIKTNPESRWDPLSYAKRFRANEPELLSLLSRPLSDWLTSTNTPPAYQPSPVTESQSTARSDVTIPLLRSANTRTQRPTKKIFSKLQQPAATRPWPMSLLNSSPVNSMRSFCDATESAMAQLREENPCTYRTAPFASDKSTTDHFSAGRLEMENLKMLCLAVLKSQRKLIIDFQTLISDREESGLKGTDPSSSPSVAQPFPRDATALRAWQETSTRHFRTQLIALDMKEKAMKAHVRGVERRIMHRLQDLQKEAIVVATEHFGEQLKDIQDCLNLLQLRMNRLDETSKITRTGNPDPIHSTALSNRHQRKAVTEMVSYTPFAFAEEGKTNEDDDLRSLLTDESLLLTDRKQQLMDRPAINVLRVIFCRSPRQS